MRVECKEKGYESIVDVYLDTDGALILDVWTGGPGEWQREPRRRIPASEATKLSIAQLTLAAPTRLAAVFDK